MTPPNPSLYSLPEPDPDAAAHSVRLAARIRAEIATAGGSLPFSRFMQLALYAPELGYYRAGLSKFGPAGDFITAPELSPLFSRCVARQCAEVLARTGGSLLEIGAGSGVMAADVLTELAALDCLPERYLILELSAELRERQRRTLAERAPDRLERVQWLDRLPEPGWHGVIVANEVMDAMPVERFRLTPAGPRPLHVVSNGVGFAWCEGDADPAVTAAVAAICHDLVEPLPVGYESEFNPSLPGWLAALAEGLASGLILLIDYGYPRREYYHPQRTDGTLLCHYRHRVHVNPLILCGLQDITASVDFSAAAAAGAAAGLDVVGYTSQAYFLFGCGLEQRLAEVPFADTRRYLEATRQVKTLTLPGEMGERFKVLALTRNLTGSLCGFTLFDERGRL